MRKGQRGLRNTKGAEEDRGGEKRCKKNKAVEELGGKSLSNLN